MKKTLLLLLITITLPVMAIDNELKEAVQLVSQLNNVTIDQSVNTKCTTGCPGNSSDNEDHLIEYYYETYLPMINKLTLVWHQDGNVVMDGMWEEWYSVNDMMNQEDPQNFLVEALSKGRLQLTHNGPQINSVVAINFYKDLISTVPSLIELLEDNMFSTHPFHTYRLRKEVKRLKFLEEHSILFKKLIEDADFHGNVTWEPLTIIKGDSGHDYQL